MAIRHFIAAGLMASACIAQANVVQTPQSAFLSGWTTANGTSVLGSGVLSSNVNLIGGVSYGAGASAADALLNQASANLGTAGTQLYYTKGVEGMYLLGSGHGILAAMLGNGVSVVGSNGGVTVGQGISTALSTGNVGPIGSADAGHARPSDLPEPSTLALLMAGVFGVGALRRRAR